jgi:fructosamine-3-kinase
MPSVDTSPPEGTPTFVKRFNPSAPATPHVEAAGLRWLAEATAEGGVRTPEIYGIDQRTLILERIAPGPATRAAAQVFGRALAITHAAGAPYLGAPPPGVGTDGSIGLAPLTFPQPSEAPAMWGAFYADYRLEPFLVTALRDGTIPAEARGVFDALEQRLHDGEFDSPQPALVRSTARIHGDLWNGNVLWQTPRDDGAWTGAIVIDPAAHGGHGETDLAMLNLFGAPHLEEIVSAYHEVSALGAGWRSRIGLHQLHPLLVHAALFGPPYGMRALDVARRYI